MKVIVVGDTYVDPKTMEEQARRLAVGENLDIVTFYWGNGSKTEFRQKAHHIELEGPEAEEIPRELYEEIRDADMILTHFCPIPAGLIERAERLKLIGTCRTGMEHIDVEAATRRNIPVVHCIRNAMAVADFVLGLIISETRNIARGYKGITEGKWGQEFPNSQYTTTLDHLTVGLVGLGYIGKLVAGKLNALGMEVLGTDPFVTGEELLEEGLKVTKVEMEDLFASCDIVSLHLRASEETRNIIDKRLLGLMKPGSYLINTSRAGIIVEEDLLEILKEKKIAGAAIDVWWEEPIPSESEFLKLDNVTATPHIAGETVDAIPMSPKLMVDEINKFLRTGKNSMVVNLKQISA
jgi:Phosphoglycerate dehydrogenase and related dehydrogenases